MAPWRRCTPRSGVRADRRGLTPMPAFAYQALDADGRTRRGTLQGDTARAVRGLLRERGLDPLSVDEIHQGMAGGTHPFARRGLGGAQLALLTRNLQPLPSD